MTPDELATAGRALYGERWQTSLAQDLHVSDRTMRRWLAGEFPIPAGVATELRAVLVERLKVIGGIAGYQVVRQSRRIHNYRTGSSYRYDDADHVALLHPGMSMPDQIPLVTEGAKEALRREHEHDPGVRVMWVDQAGRPAAVTGLHGFLRGSVVIPPGVDLTDPVAEEAFAAEEGEIHR